MRLHVGYPAFASAKQVEQYLESYASNFDLLPYIQLSKSVTRVERDEDNNKWIVTITNVKNGVEEIRKFSRVIIATGILSRPNIPKPTGIERFQGEAIHSRAFKDPAKYEGKRVVVVGIGATGADAVSFLKASKAAKVYLSHRSQILLVGSILWSYSLSTTPQTKLYQTPKSIDGKPFDQQVTYRFLSLVQAFGSFAPSMFINLMSKAVVSMRKKAFPWLDNHPSFRKPRPFQKFLHRIPMTSLTLAENLRDDSIETVFGIQEITGPHSLKMTDGKTLEHIDAIIFCTGYDYDFSIVSGAGSPTDPDIAPDRFDKIKATKFYNPDSPFPRLYQGIISEQFPESLAFLGHSIMMGSLFVIYDIYTMALASVWAGNYPQASPTEMARDIDTQYSFVVGLLKEGPVPHLGFRLIVKGTWNWMHKAAGTGMTERIASFNWAAWKFWWSDRHFYNLLMDGITAPAMYRLFDTRKGRKPWLEAKAQIEASNEQARLQVEEWKKHQKMPNS